MPIKSAWSYFYGIAEQKEQEMQYTELLTPEMQETLKLAGYDTPTPIQEQSLEILLNNQDLIGVAQGFDEAHAVSPIAAWSASEAVRHSAAYSAEVRNASPRG